MKTKTVRRSIAITPEMRDLLRLLVNKRRGEVCEADLIREAIRRYLDEQADIVGSRRHFQKTFQDRIDHLEIVLSFHLNVLLYLTALSLALMLPHFTKTPTTVQQLLQQAIIAARRDGDALLAQIDAVRDMPDPRKG